MRQCFKAVEVSFSSKCSFDTVEVPSGVGSRVEQYTPTSSAQCSSLGFWDLNNVGIHATKQADGWDG